MCSASTSATIVIGDVSASSYITSLRHFVTFDGPGRAGAFAALPRVDADIARPLDVCPARHVTAFDPHARTRQVRATAAEQLHGEPSCRHLTLEESDVIARRPTPVGASPRHSELRA